MAIQRGRVGESCGWIRTARLQPFLPGHHRETLSEDYGSSANKFRTLSLRWCFPLVWWGAALVGSNCLVFSKGAPTTGLPNDPTVYTASPPLDADHTLEWVVVVPSVCPRSLSFHISAKYHGSSLPHQFILELEGFPYVSVENWVWKCNQEGGTFLPA